MISNVLYMLSRGWAQVRNNTKLLFICVVLFIFPLLFVVVLERFYAVADANIQTMDNNAIGMYQDSVAVTSAQAIENAQEVIEQVVATNPDITDTRIYKTIAPDTVEVIYSLEADLVGSTTTTPLLLRTTLQETGQTFTTTVYRGSNRSVQAARAMPTSDNTTLYLYSEHSRSSIDTVLAQRKQDAYIALTVIFVFLISLAYWISRQSDWENKYSRLSATLAERDLFSNMIAHEFRTPLTAIKGYASFLQESTTLSAEEQRFADTIRESAERLVLLVNDFLEVARIQSGRMTLELTEVDVRTPIKRVVDSLRQEAEHKGLELSYTAGLQPQPLNTDQNRFVQILTNIISNSIKYTNKGSVTISCETERGGIVIRVKDTGMGISAEDQEKLFTPFSRVGGVEKTATTGTGLGMWITKQMIELLGGTIAIESIKDVGTHAVLHFNHTK